LGFYLRAEQEEETSQQQKEGFWVVGNSRESKVKGER